MNTSKVTMPALKKGDRVPLRLLSVGDRFFKLHDAKRIVWQRVEGKSRQTKYQWLYPVKTDVMRRPEMMSGTTDVVYLRSVNDGNNEQ